MRIVLSSVCVPVHPVHISSETNHNEVVTAVKSKSSGFRSLCWNQTWGRSRSPRPKSFVIVDFQHILNRSYRDGRQFPTCGRAHYHSPPFYRWAAFVLRRDLCQSRTKNSPTPSLLKENNEAEILLLPVRPEFNLGSSYEWHRRATRGSRSDLL